MSTFKNKLAVLGLLFIVTLPSLAFGADTQTSSTLLRDQLTTLALWGVLGVFILLVVLGATNRVVIFYNGTDAFWAVFPFVSIVVSFLIVFSMSPSSKDAAQAGAQTSLPTIVMVVGGIAALGGGIMTLYNSIKYNKNVLLGLLVGVCKLVISVFMALLAINYILEIAIGKNLGQKLWAIVLFGWIAWLWKKLINGEHVYERKGWPLPT